MNFPVFVTKHQDREVLAIDTGLSPTAFAQSKMGSLLSEYGAIVWPNGNIEAWVPEGTLEIDGHIAIYGPVFTGKSLVEMLAGEKPDISLAYQFSLSWLKCQNILQKADRPYRLSPSPYAAMLAEDASLLLLPEQSFRRAIQSRNTELAYIDAWTHPELKGEEAPVFTAAILLYSLLTARAPWSAENAEHIRSRMRETAAMPTVLAHPGIQEELGKILDRALLPPQVPGKEKKNSPLRPSLSELSEFFLTPARSDISSLYTEILPENLKKILKTRKKFERGLIRKERLKNFFKRNRGRVIALSIAAIALALISIDIFKTAKSRPTTLNLSPLEVVEMYYDGFTPLNHEGMEACLAKEAPKWDITTVMNYFVTSKMRISYEMLHSHYDPNDFLNKNETPRGFVFGISDVSMKEIQNSDENPIWEVNYTLWYPSAGTADNPNAPGNAAESIPEASFERRQDVLHLVYRKDRWLIADIVRTIQ